MPEFNKRVYANQFLLTPEQKKNIMSGGVETWEGEVIKHAGTERFHVLVSRGDLLTPIYMNQWIVRDSGNIEVYWDHEFKGKFHPVEKKILPDETVVGQFMQNPIIEEPKLEVSTDPNEGAFETPKVKSLSEILAEHTDEPVVETPTEEKAIEPEQPVVEPTPDPVPDEPVIPEPVPEEPATIPEPVIEEQTVESAVKVPLPPEEKVADDIGEEFHSEGAEASVNGHEVNQTTE